MKKVILLFVSFAMVLCMQAEPSHKFLEKQIGKHKNCKSVAITKKNCDALLYGDCGWATTKCPVAFSRKLFELSEWGDTIIQDIHLSELGRWFILYGNNQVSSYLLYENLEEQIQRCQEKKDNITTVTFNDKGDWIVICENSLSASSDDLMDWLSEGCQKYGQLWTACVTDNAAIAIYEFGFKYWGSIPEDLKNALRTCKSDVYTVKIAGNAWFFKCTNGYWRCHL